MDKLLPPVEPWRIAIWGYILAMKSGGRIGASILGCAILLMGGRLRRAHMSEMPSAPQFPFRARARPLREPAAAEDSDEAMRLMNGACGPPRERRAKLREGRFRFDGASRSPILTPVPSGTGFSGNRQTIRAGMAIDTDGPVAGYDPRVHRDPHRQRETSLRYIDGSSINPTVVPYVVVPSSHKGWLGDFVMVEYRGRQVMAVVADCGPRFGEGSVALAQQLGIPSHGVSGGAEDGVTYTFYPDSGRRYSGQADIKTALLRRSGASPIMVADAAR